jgi:RNA polymerase sigma factor (sigma-70 family)
MASRVPVLPHLHRLLAGGDSALSDPQLLEVFLARRDEAAFATLVRRHGPMVLAVCRRLLPDAGDVEDAFQATFLVLVRKARAVGRPERLGNWLYGVAYRTALKARGRHARRRAREQPLTDVAVEGEVAALVWRELRPLLDEELCRLPEKYRAPVVLCCLEGLSKRAAARHLGWAEGTLSARLHQARGLLRQRLLRRGLTLSAGVVAAALPEGAASAAVPAALTAATAKFAALLAAGSAAVPAGTLTLMEGVIQAMFLNKIKVAAGALLAAALLAVGVAGVVNRVPAAPQNGDGPGPPAGKIAADPAPGQDQARPKTLTLDPEVTRVVWSPDGRHLASYAERTVLRKDRVAFDTVVTVKVWDATTGKMLAALGDGKNRGLIGVGFAPDGKTVALSYRGPKADFDCRVDLFDVRTGKQVSSLRPVSDGDPWFAFAPDGKTLAVLHSGAGTSGALVMDVSSGKMLWSLFNHNGPTTAVAFAPDGRRLVTGGGAKDHTLRACDVESGKVVWVTDTPGGVGGIAFAPDGKLLAVGQGDGKVLLLDAATGKGVRLFSARGRNVQPSFSPDGRLLLCPAEEDRDGNPAEVRLWEVASGKLVRVWRDTRASAAFVPGDGTVAVLGKQGELQLWALTHEPERVVPKKLATAEGHFKRLVDELFAAKKTDEQIVEALFLASVGRFPTADEDKVALAHLAKNQKRRRAAVEDLLFALTNSQEFFARLDALNQADPRKK